MERCSGLASTSPRCLASHMQGLGRRHYAHHQLQPSRRGARMVQWQWRHHHEEALQPSTATQAAAAVPGPAGGNPYGQPGGMPMPQGAAAMPGGVPAKKSDTPLQQKILNGILGISNVPYSSFVPTPETFLHKVDARIKQLWLVAIYFMIARATPGVRLAIAGVVALATIAVFPPRLWKSQLLRLGLLCGMIFTFSALGADGVPPLLQGRAPPASLEGLPDIPDGSYHYVFLHVFFVTVTHRSVNLGLTAAALTFCALQSASLCLVTTPGEEMAAALRWWLTPLRALRVPVREISLTLLLSLRFMSLVFEEVRNLCLGLAARGVDWRAQGGRGSLLMVGRLVGRLFANLFHRSENIAQAMQVRGFQGPEQQTLYMMRVNKTSVVANVMAIALLGGFFALIGHYK